MVNFLSVPLKSTNEVDLVKPLQNYVDSMLQVNPDLKTEINEGIIELNKLRNKACNQLLDKSQTSLELLTRYYDQLNVIENKLPITATMNPVAFKWKDAFDKGGLFVSRASLTISDSSFERASVLFNAGALMSAIASNQQRNSDEDLKTMSKLFQQSAGVFTKLKESVLGLVQQEPTPDLMPDTLAALAALMLAQAQEAIYIKAAKDQMKAILLVKISAQCGELYQDAQKSMTRDVVKGIWEREWLSTVNGKVAAMNALAQYHAGQAADENKEIGETIARLNEAKKLMEQANSYLGSGAYGTEYAAIQKATTQAVKDNDFIYHERVPEFRTLPALPKAVLAKPIPVAHPLSPRFKDMFESLVPVSVQNALTAFEGRKLDVVNMETGRMREYTQLMNGILASLNLPAALDDVANHERCPESIRQKSSKVKAAGGLTSIQSKLAEIPSLYKRNDEILNETTRLVRDEKTSDDNLRSQFGDKWTRMQSDSLTGPLQAEMGKYRGILNTAQNADGIVANKFEAAKKGIEMLSKPENELQTLIPGASGKEGNQNSEAVQKLRQLMDKVQAIKVERENYEKALKEVRINMADDFLRSMAENGVVNEEKLSMDKINELYGALKEKISKSLQEQEGVLAEVQTWNSKFSQEKGSGGVERENILKLLAASYDAYFEIESNLKEGTKFYNELTPLLVRLQQKVSDFCFARQTEKEDLMKQVQQNIISGGGQPPQTKPANPPPRPPPPSFPQQGNPNAASGATETPMPPPRTQSNIYQATPTPQMPITPMGHQQNIPQQQPFQQGHQPYPQHAPQHQQPFYGQPNPYLPYATPSPYAAPNPYVQQPQQPHQPQFYSTPYPMTYPGTYPGAYPQQQYGAYMPSQYPPAPQFPVQPSHQAQPGQNPNNPFQ